MLSKLKTRFEKLRTYWQTSYLVNGYSINIPKKHSLSFYQKQYPLYDRFLPILVRNIKDSGAIVDVGANIGDTLFSTLFETKNPFICIEGSSFFYTYLQENIALLPVDEQKRITTYHKLAGTGDISGDLTHESSRTAHLDTSSVSSDISTHQPLDIIVDGKEKIALIKSDTDGYDWDVLLSAKSIIKKDAPVLYWENEVRDQFQFQKYLELYQFLEQNDYQHVYILDNYGNILMKDVELKHLESLNQYILSMNQSKSARTIYYVDILAVTSKDKAIADQTIAEFSILFLK